MQRTGLVARLAGALLVLAIASVTRAVHAQGTTPPPVEPVTPAQAPNAPPPSTQPPSQVLPPEPTTGTASDTTPTTQPPQAGTQAQVQGQPLALAQAPKSQRYEYSAYEKETIKRALEGTGSKLETNPEGRTIEGVEVVRLEVLEDRDPIPEDIIGIKARKIMNSLHYTSRDFVIRRELLVKEGDPYVQYLIDETARNMRVRMPLQVSVVIIVPTKAVDPNKVRLLVITKDIWSLRLSFDLAATPGGLETFTLVPQETNVLGWQHTLQTKFVYQPETLSFGVGYNVPRFGKSWIGASVGAGITVNQRSGEAEGSSANITVGQGLYWTRAEWAWAVDADYAIGVSRRYSNAKVVEFDSRTTPGVVENIRNEYKSRSFSASVGVTRSFGWALKNNFSLSMKAASTEYETFDLSRYDPAAARDFISRYVPRGETRVYPVATWSTFRNDYIRTLDVNTLALQEDFRLGHDVSASIYPVTKALGSTRNLVGLSASAGYTIALGDGLVRATASTVAENSEGLLSDASVSSSLYIITPRMGFGRFAMSTSFINRYKNYLRSRTITGGDDRLRGYPTNFLVGKDALFYNFEFRSTSFELLKCAFGGVLFYDAADAAQGMSSLSPKHSVGFGIRALFPQVNRAVFRLDFAFPLNRGPFPDQGIVQRVDPFGFFFAFNQAF